MERWISMRLEHYPVDKLARELRDIIGQHLDLSKYRVFFFGSRVAGTGDDRSDVDVGIEGPEPIPSGVLGTIAEAVEGLPTLYKVDVVDFRTAGDQFRRVALECTESLEAAIADSSPPPVCR